ncbi:beta-glucosidase BglX [Polaribacter sp. PL03]|uniref:beta-glucosidase BglX n=1 Tax=Polaribacter sp. PL03 TaxID=3088353 RepID=UPI0029CC51BD|nr:beta-glucosidase BglX [Polaribacter sp. PL03]MDX6746646.1 beta-glucosidase BglX [Polaribacter sp. PL03]
MKNSIFIICSSLFLMFSCSRNVEKKDFIEDLISKMTLQEKAGQLNLIPTTGFNKTDSVHLWIKKGLVGHVQKSIGVKNNYELQKIAVENSRLGIPLLFQEDIIHGYKTIAPVPLAEASSWDLAAIRKSAAIAAREASSAGIHLTFAPMVDIARDPRWGRILEGAGEDVYLGSLIAAARVKGFQESNKENSNILATVKHFVGYGASLAGRDYNILDFSERELRETHLPPFKAAIDAGVSSVMTAYSAYDGVPLVANNFLLKDVLRDELKFKGLVMTDWETVGNLVKTGIAKNDTIATKMSLLAGNDIDMSTKKYVNLLPEMVRKGIISEAVLDNSVRNVLLLKQKAGLFKDPYAYFNEEREAKELLSEENIQATKEMAVKSMVLLKNKNNVLPLLKKKQRIAIIGPFAKAQKDLLGWWSSQGNPNDVVSIFAGIKKRVPQTSTISYAQGCIVEDFEIKGVEMIADAVRAANNADVIVLALGEKEWMSGEGGGTASLLLPGAQQQLLDAVAKTGKPIITLIVSGRPYVLTDVVKKSTAVLQVWMPGTTGGTAVAEILFGDYNPSGKLTVTFPFHQGQVPIYYNYKKTSHSFNAGPKNNRYTTTHRDITSDPLFPFGFGLSYNSYSYKNLKLDKTTMNKNDSIKVSVDVTNKGKYNGREIVQLYIHDKVCSVTRPVKELKDFLSLELKPNETKTATFYITSDKLRFIGLDYKTTIEEGAFEVFVGKNSSDTSKLDFWLE